MKLITNYQVWAPSKVAYGPKGTYEHRDISAATHTFLTILKWSISPNSPLPCCEMEGEGDPVC